MNHAVVELSNDVLDHDKNLGFGHMKANGLDIV